MGGVQGQGKAGGLFSKRGGGRQKPKEYVENIMGTQNLKPRIYKDSF